MFKMNRKHFFRKLRKVDTFFHDILSTVLKSPYSEKTRVIFQEEYMSIGFSEKLSEAERSH